MPQPWWTTDTYDHDHAVPAQFRDAAGPNGVAMVRVWDDGKTDAGWGLTDKEGKPAFIPLYKRKRFAEAPIMVGYTQRKWAFAFVMRSMKLICIDIDGKNGGQLHAGKLGMLPLTLAETSKSGDGHHLFYATTEDEWDALTGYSEFADRIGIEQGVDIRAVGCVFHYHQQMWNGRHITELPLHLKDRLLKHRQTVVAHTAAIIKTIESEDPLEVVIMHDQLLQDLKKPIPAGRRNNTLFAIGQQLKLAQYPNWENVLHTRATDVGLDKDEADKLVANVRRYN